jgi:hypothetical protein
MNETIVNVDHLDDITIHRMLTAINYSPLSERMMNRLVEFFSVRPHAKANPGMDPDSEEFVESLPAMPNLVTRLFDVLGTRAVKVNQRWAKESMLTGKTPPKRYRRG